MGPDWQHAPPGAERSLSRLYARPGCVLKPHMLAPDVKSGPRPPSPMASGGQEKANCEEQTSNGRKLTRMKTWMKARAAWRSFVSGFVLWPYGPMGEGRDG